jgi:hypothetical protein
MTADGDLTTITRALTRALTRITNDGPNLIRRANISSDVDGYPRSASGAPPSTATAPPDEPATIDYSDPTGRTVVTRMHGGHTPDPIAAIGRRFIRRLEEAERALHHATLELDMANPARRGDTTASDDQWCANHLAHGMCEPRYRGDLCEWCYKFQLAERALPVRMLVVIKHEKGRITQADITKAMGKQRLGRKAG